MLITSNIIEAYSNLIKIFNTLQYKWFIIYMSWSLFFLLVNNKYFIYNVLNNTINPILIDLILKDFPSHLIKKKNFVNYNFNYF